jgi:hypothetical protein
MIYPFITIPVLDYLMGIEELEYKVVFDSKKDPSIDVVAFGFHVIASFYYESLEDLIPDDLKECYSFKESDEDGLIYSGINEHYLLEDIAKNHKKIVIEAIKKEIKRHG